MVRNYKKKGLSRKWTKSSMLQAVKDIVHSKMTRQAAMKKNGVTSTTLRRYCAMARQFGMESVEASISGANVARMRVFTDAEEYYLRRHIQAMNLDIATLESTKLRQIAFQFAEANNIKHKFNRASGMAGYDWYAAFMKRHQDRDLETPPDEVFTSGLNFTFSDQKFFDLLTDFHEHYDLTPDRIYQLSHNCSISIPDLTSRVYTSGDARTLQVKFITTLICANGSGHFIPPILIYPTALSDPKYTQGLPTGTKIVCNPTGEIVNEIFFPLWFEHFLAYVKRRGKKQPILVLFDSDSAYVKCLEIVERAKQLNVHFLGIPNSRRMQLRPLEYDFMSGLKESYAAEQENWLKESEKSYVDLASFGEVFGKAYARAATKENCAAGFSSSGVYPLNSQICLNFVECKESKALANGWEMDELEEAGEHFLAGMDDKDMLDVEAEGGEESEGARELEDGASNKAKVVVDANHLYARSKECVFKMLTA